MTNLKQSVAVHFQYIPENSEGLMKDLFHSGKPFGASFVPVFFWKGLQNKGKDIKGRVYREKSYYPKWVKYIFEEGAHNPDITNFQEGFLHYCEGCFKKYQKNGGRDNPNAYPDPWHEIDWFCENVPKRKSLKKAIMETGKEFLEEVIGSVDDYCPPQHYSSKESLKAANELDYEYFMFRNLTQLPVFKEDKLTMLPCAKIREPHYKTSPVVFTYFDHLVNNSDLRKEFLNFLDNSVPFSELPVSKKPKLRFWFNQKMLRMAKKKRDLNKIAKSKKQ